MKYIVELKYTNPGHEHVSLRRRVDTVTRLVEASNEQEALNRATNQQRALGFKIQEAKVVTPATEPVQLSEGFDTDPADIAAYLVDRHGKGKVTMDHIEAYERRRDSHRPIEKHEVMKHVKKLSEEVEQVEEGKIAKALAVGAMSLASMGAKAHTDTTKSVAQLAHERPALAQKLHDIGASGQVPASDKRAAELQRKQDQEMPASERRANELKKEEVGADKRDAGYKMSPAVRAAQKKSDVLSKVVKRPQAGTLAAVHKSMERTMERNMKKEAADPGSMKVVNKKVKAADKMVGAAKKAAVVNFEPELKITRPMV